MKFEQLALRILLIVLAFFLGVAMARADGPYVTGSLGQARYSLTAPDGSWRQEALGHHATRESLAWSVGAGYQWDHLAVEASYLNFGAVSDGGSHVSDEEYGKRNLKDVEKFDATDRIQGGVLKAIYRVNIMGFTPFLSAGVWGGQHTLTWWATHPHGVTDYTMSGMLLGGVAGGGICYQWVSLQVEYYKAFAQTGFPISTEIVLPSVKLNVPLSAFSELAGSTRDYLWQR